MDRIEEFTASLNTPNIPANLPLHVQALWFDGVGDWRAAHDLIDQLQDTDSAHVHAYLHRKEGDIWNADYWYRKAGRKSPDFSLDEEWKQLVQLFLVDGVRNK